MSLEIKGKVTSVLDLQTGNGKNGTWKKQGYVVETLDSKYPKNVCFDVWGDKIDTFNIQLGMNVTAAIEIESREYNGKWYTNIQAWSVKTNNADTSDFIDEVSNNVVTPNAEEDGDDLPF